MFNSKRKSILKKIRANSGSKRYEVLIVKSSKNMSAYIYDTIEKKTLIGSTTSSKDFKGDNEDLTNFASVKSSIKFGSFFRNKISSLGIDSSDMYFNRSGYIFHGRVKAFNESFFNII